MSEKSLYVCNVSFQTMPLGTFHSFITYAISTSTDLAVKVAIQKAEQIMQPGWSISGVWAGVVSRDFLEQAAVEVLGWDKPSKGIDRGKQ